MYYIGLYIMSTVCRPVDLLSSEFTLRPIYILACNRSCRVSVKAIYGVCILLWGYGGGGLVPQDIQLLQGYSSDVTSGLSAILLLVLDSVLELECSTPIWHHLIIRCNNCRAITISCNMHK